MNGLLGRDSWVPVLPLWAAVWAMLCVVPSYGMAQQADWGLFLSPQITRSLGEEGGPALGALGGAVQVVRTPSGGGWALGGAATLHRLGTFTSPNVPARTNRAFALGIRALRTSPSHPWYFNVGGDVMAVEERVHIPSDAGWSRDPGVGVYIGVGWLRQGVAGSPGLFFESGLTGVLATGESTAGGGVYLSLKTGIRL